MHKSVKKSKSKRKKERKKKRMKEREERNKLEVGTAGFDLALFTNPAYQTYHRVSRLYM